jgi:hypothetical protein
MLRKRVEISSYGNCAHLDETSLICNPVTVADEVQKMVEFIVDSPLHCITFVMHLPQYVKLHPVFQNGNHLLLKRIYVLNIDYVDTSYL